MVEADRFPPKQDRILGEHVPESPIRFVMLRLKRTKTPVGISSIIGTGPRVSPDAASRTDRILNEFKSLKKCCQELRLGLCVDPGRKIAWDDDIRKAVHKLWSHVPARRGGMFLCPPIFPEPVIVVVSRQFCELGIFFHEREHWRQWHNNELDYTQAAWKDLVNAELRCEKYALNRLIRLVEGGELKSLDVFVNGILKLFTPRSMSDAALYQAREILLANSPVWKKAMKVLGRS